MSHREVNLSGVSVCIGMPINRDVPFKTHVSSLMTTCALKDHGVPFAYQWAYGSSIVEKARCDVAAAFLETDCDCLFWVDSDISWKPEDFLRLVALSREYDVVGATYPCKTDRPTFLVNFDDTQNIETNDHGLLKAKSFGLGFTVVSRQVMQELAAKAPLVKFPGSDKLVPHMFRCDSHDGEFFGEDILFFDDVRALGYDVWLDPTIQLGHNGDKEYTGDIRTALRSVPREPAECAA